MKLTWKFQSSIDFGFLKKLKIWWNFWKFSKFVKFFEMKKDKRKEKIERASALRVIWAETRLTVYRSLPYWCGSQTRPRVTAIFCNIDLFGHVFRCQFENVWEKCHSQNKLWDYQSWFSLSMNIRSQWKSWVPSGFKFLIGGHFSWFFWNFGTPRDKIRKIWFFVLFFDFWN